MTHDKPMALTMKQIEHLSANIASAVCGYLGCSDHHQTEVAELVESGLAGTPYLGPEPDRLWSFERQLGQAFGGDRWRTYPDPIRVLADSVTDGTRVDARPPLGSWAVLNHEPGLNDVPVWDGGRPIDVCDSRSEADARARELHAFFIAPIEHVKGGWRTGDAHCVERTEPWRIAAEFTNVTPKRVRQIAKMLGLCPHDLTADRADLVRRELRSRGATIAVRRETVAPTLEE